MLRSLGLGLSLETFAKFLGFRFGQFGLGKKVSVLVSDNLVSEKNLGIGFGQNFGIVIQ